MSTLKDDPVVALLEAEGVEVTRQNWIDLSYGHEVPSPWTAECEAELPDELQDWSQVVVTDN
jgi:hypothetical protein